MDDPLSAVDAHVSKYLFGHCIQGAMAGKTRVLVTHQLQYAPRADLVVFMREGRVAELGSFDALMERPDSEFAHLFRTYGGGGGGGGGEDKHGQEEGEEEGDLSPVGEGGEGAAEKASSPLPSSGTGASTTGTTGTTAAAGAAAPQTLMTTEERAQGGLGLEVWLYYFKAFGGAPWVALIMGSVGLQTAIKIYNDYCTKHTTHTARRKRISRLGVSPG